MQRIIKKAKWNVEVTQSKQMINAETGEPVNVWDDGSTRSYGKDTTKIDRERYTEDLSNADADLVKLKATIQTKLDTLDLIDIEMNK